ncbi:hypothetical protein [Shimia sp.]|uniref:hypothetical protein n=1 Tax=Shimia sp. TaxID=1954381 RepID=UPI003298A068
MSAASDPRALRRFAPGMSLPGGTQIVPEMQAVRFSLQHESGPVYLDGNQYSSEVDIVTDPGLAGVKWSLQAKPDGSWRITNQAALKYGLSADQGRARLCSLDPDLDHTDRMADWLIYLCGREGHILLRPVGGTWLVTDGASRVGFDRIVGEDPARGLWQLLP